MKELKWVLLFVAIIGCGGGDDDDGLFEPQVESPSTFGIRHDRTLAEYEEVATNRAPYHTAAYPDFSPVVAFTYSLDGSDEPDHVATGVLVAPDWILTAGHSFFTSDDQDAPAPPGGITVRVGTDPNDPVSTHAVAALIFHPTWIEHNDVYGYGNDLCLVQLAEPVDSVIPAAMNFDADEPVGETVWYCGFGDYSQQEGQDPDLYSLKHALENILDRKSDGIFTDDGDTRYEGGLLAFDFDSPFEDFNTLGDDFISEDEPLLGDGDSGAFATEFEGATVEGDSGGPLFIRVGNEWKVAGILSGSPEEPIAGHEGSNYGDISIFIRVSTHRAWIESIVEPPG